MQSKAANVDAYLAEAPADRLAALTQLRAICVELLPDCVEGMDYGMPTYKRGEELTAAFASQKANISLYGMSAVMERHRSALKGCDLGKGCIRFKKPERMDFALIRRMMEEKIALKGAPGC